MSVRGPFPEGWFAIARSSEVKKRPLRRQFLGTPLVFFRTGGTVAVLHDRCPHRSARLSDGRVVEGTIECPYHGWRFDGGGRCTKIPLADGEVPRRFVPTLPVCERSGLIFVRNGTAGPPEPHVPFWQGPKPLRIVLSTETTTTLTDLVENAFEPIHPFFVHRSILRGLGEKRSTATFKLSGDNHRLDLILSGDVEKDGLLSKLFEGGRTLQKCALLAPGVLEVQYWNGDRLNLVATLYFTPNSVEHHFGYAVIEAPRQYGLSYLKALLFVPMVRALLRQDTRMLRNTHENWIAFGRPPHAASPLDLLRPHIEALLRNERPAVADHPIEFRLEI